MKLLLDTHIWIWSVDRPDRLGSRARKAIGSPAAEIWLSPVSVWEVLLLVGRGRLKLDRAPERWIEEALVAAPMRDAVLTRDVAVETGRLPPSLTDPADRFIAATARVYGLTLVTADERLTAIEAVTVLPGR